MKIVERRVCWHSTQRSSIAAVGELSNCLPGTEAKLITKSRS
jgi:hypothetical protein